MGAKKTVIVTGSASGVGAATALGLARRGYEVLINYARSEREAAEVQAACSEAGADTLLVQADVAVDTDCRRMVDAAMARWQRIDALVNNAGISVFGDAASWDALDLETFHRIYDVNVVGAFQMVRACTPHLKLAADGGAIVNVSSVAGALGIGSSLPYIASKGAINSMTLHLARTLAPEIRVNAVCPGMITTRWFKDGIGEAGFQTMKAQYERNTPLARACTAEDVAEAVIWLVDGARTVTGELVLLDAGMHLGAAPAALKSGGR